MAAVLTKALSPEEQKAEALALPLAVKKLYADWTQLIQSLGQLPPPIAKKALDRINKAGEAHLKYTRTGQRGALADAVEAITPATGDEPQLQQFLTAALQALAKALLATGHNPYGPPR